MDAIVDAVVTRMSRDPGIRARWSLRSSRDRDRRASARAPQRSRDRQSSRDSIALSHTAAGSNPTVLNAAATPASV
eukprot:329969-Prymnesium_polylepis.2